MSDIKFISFNGRGHQSIKREMASLLYELDREYFPTPWTLKNWEELQSEHDRLLVVMYGHDSIIGFCLFEKSVADSFAHLLKILVIPRERQAGGAKRLLDHSLLQLHAEGCFNLFLEVEEDNLAAQKLYSGAGFKIIHRKKDFYGADRSALIMTKEGS